jgi:hypothetical protein
MSQTLPQVFWALALSAPVSGPRAENSIRNYSVWTDTAGNAISCHNGGITRVTTGAIGKPLRKDVSGLRVVIVRDTGLEHRFYHLGELPNRINLSPPKKSAYSPNPLKKSSNVWSRTSLVSLPPVL